MLMVVAPMEQELAELRRTLHRRRREPLAVPVELHTVGVGQGAGPAIKAALKAWTPWPYPGGDRLEGLVLLGFAGALAPYLSVGDLLLSARYYGHGQGEVQQPDQRMFQAANAAVSKTQQTVFQLDSLTVDHLVATPEEKQALARRYPVGAVNMEDFWAAAAAQEAGVPFLAVRAVLDLSTQRLPSYLPKLPASRAGAALSLAAAPWRVPSALGLARQARVASAALACFAQEFSLQSLLAPSGR